MAKKPRSHKHSLKPRSPKPKTSNLFSRRRGLSVQLIAGVIAFMLLAGGSLAQWRATTAPSVPDKTVASAASLPEPPARPVSDVADELPPEPPMVYPTTAGYNAHTSGGLPPGALPAGVVLPGMTNSAMSNPNAGYSMGMMPTMVQGGRTTAQGYGVYDGVRQGFTGYERDSETGLDYAQARYYSPTQGRFTSVDPENASADLEDPQSWNGYAYARNNPLKYVDRDGRQFEICPSDGGKCFKHDDKDIYKLRKDFGGTLQGGRNSGNVIDNEGNVVGTYQRTSYDYPVEGLTEQFNRYPIKSLFGTLYGGSLLAGTGAGGAAFLAGGLGAPTTLGLTGTAAAGDGGVAALASQIQFTATTASRQALGSRRVPLQTLAQAILKGRRMADPQNAPGAIKIVQEIYKNGKKYNLEIIYREADKTILHFLYK